MSNRLVFAAVTATLQQLLQPRIQLEVPSATVTTKRPDNAATTGTTAAVNVYLMSVAPNPTLRNAELPVRRADGTVTSRPCLALELRYLITCLGDESNFEPQRLLGVVMSTLHTWPVLDRAFITEALSVVHEDDPTHYLYPADLASQPERIRLSLVPMDLEELSKLWSVLFQTPYALSVAYSANVALLEPDVTPSPALPVASRAVYTLPTAPIQLISVVNAAGSTLPVTRTSSIRLKGKGLADGVVRILDEEVAPDRSTHTELEIDLSGFADLRAGVLGLTVVRYPEEEGTTLAFGFESNALPLLLRPSATVPSDPLLAPTATTVTLEFAPEVGERQRVRLVLFSGATSFAFDAPGRDAATDTIAFTIADVPPGTYIYRVSVDGADSVVSASTAGGALDSPTLDIP